MCAFESKMFNIVHFFKKTTNWRMGISETTNLTISASDGIISDVIIDDT